MNNCTEKIGRRRRSILKQRNKIRNSIFFTQREFSLKYFLTQGNIKSTKIPYALNKHRAFTWYLVNISLYENKSSVSVYRNKSLTTLIKFCWLDRTPLRYDSSEIYHILYICTHTHILSLSLSLPQQQTASRGKLHRF